MQKGKRERKPYKKIFYFLLHFVVFVSHHLTTFSFENFVTVGTSFGIGSFYLSSYRYRASSSSAHSTTTTITTTGMPSIVCCWVVSCRLYICLPLPDMENDRIVNAQHTSPPSFIHTYLTNATIFWFCRCCWCFWYAIDVNSLSVCCHRFISTCHVNDFHFSSTTSSPPRLCPTWHSGSFGTRRNQTAILPQSMQKFYSVHK